MLRIGCLFLASLSILSTPQAARSNPLTFSSSNSVCEAGQFHSVRFGIDPQIAATSEDMCQKPLNAWTAQQVALLSELTGLNQSAAQFYGLGVKSLFPSGIDLKLISTPLSVNVASASGATSANRATVTIGIDPSFKLLDIHRFIYVHELGHVASQSEGLPLPASYHALAKSSLAVEAVADALALAVVGEPSDDPDCEVSFRKFTTEQSYTNLPRGFFIPEDEWGGMPACCEEKKWAPQSCQAIHSNLSSIKDVRPFDPTEATWDYHWQLYQFDPHRLGIPADSFLLDLKKQSGLDTPHLFFEAFKTVTSPMQSWRCEIDAMSPLLPIYQSRRYNLRDIYSALRADFERRGLVQTFDRVWSKHGMAATAVIADIDAKTIVRHDAGWAYAQNFNSYEQNHPSIGNARSLIGSCGNNDIGSGVTERSFNNASHPTSSCELKCSVGNL